MTAIELSGDISQLYSFIGHRIHLKGCLIASRDRWYITASYQHGTSCENAVLLDAGHRQTSIINFVLHQTSLDVLSQMDSAAVLRSLPVDTNADDYHAFSAIEITGIISHSNQPSFQLAMQDTEIDTATLNPYPGETLHFSRNGFMLSDLYLPAITPVDVLELLEKPHLFENKKVMVTGRFIGLKDGKTYLSADLDTTHVLTRRMAVSMPDAAGRDAWIRQNLLLNAGVPYQRGGNTVCMIASMRRLNHPDAYELNNVEMLALQGQTYVHVRNFASH